MLEERQDVEPVHSWHFLVENHGVDGFGLGGEDALLAVGGLDDTIAAALEEIAQYLAHVRIVVDHEDGRRIVPAYHEIARRQVQHGYHRQRFFEWPARRSSPRPAQGFWIERARSRRRQSVVVTTWCRGLEARVDRGAQ